MSTPKPSRVFAVRVGNWVELRAAHEPPTRIASRVKKEGTRPTFKSTGYPTYVTSLVDEPFTFYLRVTVYEGGQYLSSVPLRRWTSRMKGIFPPKRGMVELPPDVAAKMLTKSGRREYLGK